MRLALQVCGLRRMHSKAVQVGVRHRRGLWWIKQLGVRGGGA